MNATPCDARLEAISAWVLGDLPIPEATALRDHLAACEGCRAYEAGLRQTATAIREDVPAPSAERVAGVLATVRREVGFAAPAARVASPPASSPAGWAGLVGAAAAAALLIGLSLPGGSGPHAGGTPRPVGEPSAQVRVTNIPGGFERVDLTTGRRERFLAWPNASVPGFETAGRLTVGTLEVEFPANYDGPEGPVSVETPGGTVTVTAKRGARYTLIQAPGASAVEPGLNRDGKTFSGDTGVVTLAAALNGLAEQAGWTVDFAPGSGAESVQTRLTVSPGVSAGTCLMLLSADAHSAGIAITQPTPGTLHVQRVRTADATAPLAPAPRREGDLFVEVRGTGDALIEAAGSRERFHATGGSTVLLVGRTFGRWDLPDHAEVALLAQRIRVQGVGDGGQVAVVAVGDADPVPVAAGDDLCGYRVQHVGPAGITLSRGTALVRVALGAAQ